MEAPCNYDELMEEVIKKGRQLYGQSFDVPETDRPTILKLLYWFMADKPAAAAAGIDTAKGILLCGPVGCGKSAMMNILNSLSAPWYQYVIRSCLQISLEFARDGYPVMEKYATRFLQEHTKKIAVCLDNLGVENDINFWGSVKTVLGILLPLRYELFVERKIITHVTTSLDSAEVGTRYGKRNRSCMREMFNVIAYPANSPDKRK